VLAGLDRRSGHPSVALAVQAGKNNRLQPDNRAEYQVFAGTTIKACLRNVAKYFNRILYETSLY
jgi:hypothetical protein